MIEASKPLVCREAGRVLLYDSRHRTVVLLLVKNTDHPRGGVWTAVGGAAKPGESTREAASRELREELHIRIPPEDLTFLLSTKSNFDFNGVPIRQTDVVYRAVFDMDTIPRSPRTPRNYSEPPGLRAKTLCSCHEATWFLKHCGTHLSLICSSCGRKSHIACC